MHTFMVTSCFVKVSTQFPLLIHVFERLPIGIVYNRIREYMPELIAKKNITTYHNLITPAVTKF